MFASFKVLFVSTHFTTTKQTGSSEVRVHMGPHRPGPKGLKVKSSSTCASSKFIM